MAIAELERVNANVARLRSDAKDDESSFEDHPLVDERIDRLEAVYRTQPTTLKGLAALVTVFMLEDFVDVEDSGLAATAISGISRAILALEQAHRDFAEPVSTP